MIASIEKALAKDPAKRYQTADEIAAELSTLSVSDSSIKDETLIEDTLLEKMDLDATTQNELFSQPQPVLQTFQIPIPETDNKPSPRRRWGWGNPRRFLELLSAAIGGGTVVVLVLICLITLAILILPRIFNL